MVVNTSNKIFFCFCLFLIIGKARLVWFSAAVKKKKLTFIYFSFVVVIVHIFPLWKVTKKNSIQVVRVLLVEYFSIFFLWLKVSSHKLSCEVRNVCGFWLWRVIWTVPSSLWVFSLLHFQMFYRTLCGKGNNFFMYRIFFFFFLFFK